MGVIHCQARQSQTPILHHGKKVISLFRNRKFQIIATALVTSFILYWLIVLTGVLGYFFDKSG